MTWTLWISVLTLASGPDPQQLAEDAVLARGGRLYDNWATVIDAKPPRKGNPTYPEDRAYADSPNSYRCKECHGWDYRGKDGAYAAGKHFTGIKGISASLGRPTAKIREVLRDAQHRYQDRLSDSDLDALALFVSKGQTNTAAMLSGTKSRGNPIRGKPIYQTVCAGCHGLDGKGDTVRIDLGALARKNPWETVHKTMNGQPGSEMPAMRSFGPQTTADILSYLQALP